MQQVPVSQLTQLTQNASQQFLNFNSPVTLNGSQILQPQPAQQIQIQTMAPAPLSNAQPVQQTASPSQQPTIQPQQQYANGNVNNDNEKFKMHQGFIAVLKVSLKF